MGRQDAESGVKRYVYVCLNEDCCKRGNEKMHSDLKQECEGMTDIEVREYICFGNCDYGANTVVFPDRVWFSGLRADDAPVVMQYLTAGVCSEKHIGQVDDELAETIWEILELEVVPEEQSVG